MRLRVLEATPDDGPELFALLPRLGAFPRPEHRSRDRIHEGDGRVIGKWVDGGEPDIVVVVARDDDDAGALLGFAMVRMLPDAFNGEPSAHLESLAVAEGAEGKGVGSALIDHSEKIAIARGARTMTLHVFETNKRAVALYEHKGYSAEWIRYIKPLRGVD